MHATRPPVNRHPDAGGSDDRFDAPRQQMVESDVVGRGVTDERVVAAMAEIRRERFVSSKWSDAAYRDRPLPIGAGQTISQPFIVAVMAEAAEIEPDDRILEVGTGSGYGAAVLSRLGREVWTIERHRSLARQARQNLRAEGIDRVTVIHGDGTRGWEPAAPFDAIVVTAGGPVVPDPLLDQLAPGGRLLMPVGQANRVQTLIRLRRVDDGFVEDHLGAVRFVPLVGV